jgi:hypothetical protein
MAKSDQNDLVTSGVPIPEDYKYIEYDKEFNKLVS